MTPAELHLTFVRHGEAQYNVLNRVNSLPDRSNDLTERGRAQARHCAGLLSGETFEAAYCSEFPRARQTAEIITASHSLVLRVDKRINETGAFAFDGRPCDDWHAALVPDRFTAAPSGCEAFGPFKARLREFLLALEKNGERRVLVVSHEEPIQIMLGILHGWTDADARSRHVPHCQPFRWRA